MGFLSKLVSLLVHGGKLDGFKKLVGGTLVLVADVIPDPSKAESVRQVGKYILLWGIGSDVAKGTKL